jgi:hypothetical protein
MVFLFQRQYTQISKPDESRSVPLSHVSMVANVFAFSSTRSASLFNNLPLAVGGRSFHEGSLNAFRAALTAISTSSGPAAKTLAISCSLLSEVSTFKLQPKDTKTYAGLIVANFSPKVDFTNSLLMNKPRGC